MKDLSRWTFRPLELLDERARTGDVFELRLWRRAVFGYLPAWNREILRDLDTFRSAGSLSSLTPYLHGGVVHLDAPGHDPRRRELNPHFHHRALAVLTDRLTDTVEPLLPDGDFDALEWAGRAVRGMLNAAFFGGRFNDDLLAEFFAPLQRPAPHPLLPRPLLFRRMRHAIAAELADPLDGTLAQALSGLDEAGEEIRVALAAGFDTTTHTLAWAIWQLAADRSRQEPELLPWVLNEVLRLYPTGWLGSRVAAADITVAGVPIRRGTLVCYSPYLTHRDPDLWPEPLAFRPERFADRPAPWTYLPFSAGSRTCLGMHLANLMLTTALAPLCASGLGQVRGDATVQTSITLRPRGPLVVSVPPVGRRAAASTSRISTSISTSHE